MRDVKFDTCIRLAGSSLFFRAHAEKRGLNNCLKLALCWGISYEQEVPLDFINHTNNSIYQQRLWIRISQKGASTSSIQSAFFGFSLEVDIVLAPLTNKHFLALTVYHNHHKKSWCYKYLTFLLTFHLNASNFSTSLSLCAVHIAGMESKIVNHNKLLTDWWRK